MKFDTRVRLEPSNDGREFELDRARSKKDIAENSVALGHEMHNTCISPVINFKTHPPKKGLVRTFKVSMKIVLSISGSLHTSVFKS